MADRHLRVTGRVGTVSRGGPGASMGVGRRVGYIARLGMDYRL